MVSINKLLTNYQNVHITYFIKRWLSWQSGGFVTWRSRVRIPPSLVPNEIVLLSVTCIDGCILRSVFQNAISQDPDFFRRDPGNFPS